MQGRSVQTRMPPKRYADYGNGLCKAALGKMYQEGGYGVDQDFTQARGLLVCRRSWHR